MSPIDPKRINVLYVFWGLLAPLSVLAWFGAHDLWPRHTHSQLASLAPARDSWEVRCTVSTAEWSRSRPVEWFVAPTLLPHQGTPDAVPGMTLLASSTGPVATPSKDNGHECPPLCP